MSISASGKGADFYLRRSPKQAGVVVRPDEIQAAVIAAIAVGQSTRRATSKPRHVLLVDDRKDDIG